jgi:hypothetical protein
VITAEDQFSLIVEEAYVPRGAWRGDYFQLVDTHPDGVTDVECDVRQGQLFSKA